MDASSLLWRKGVQRSWGKPKFLYTNVTGLRNSELLVENKFSNLFGILNLTWQPKINTMMEKFLRLIQTQEPAQSPYHLPCWATTWAPMLFLGHVCKLDTQYVKLIYMYLYFNIFLFIHKLYRFFFLRHKVWSTFNCTLTHISSWVLSWVHTRLQVSWGDIIQP